MHRMEPESNGDESEDERNIFQTPEVLAIGAGMVVCAMISIVGFSYDLLPQIFQNLQFCEQQNTLALTIVCSELRVHIQGLLFLTFPPKKREPPRYSDLVLSYLTAFRYNFFDGLPMVKEGYEKILQTDYTFGLLNREDTYEISVVRSRLTWDVAATFEQVHDKMVGALGERIQMNSEAWNHDYQKLAFTLVVNVEKFANIIAMFPEPLKPIAARILSKLPSQVRQTIELIKPIVNERFAKMEDLGDTWNDAPYLAPLRYEVEAVVAQEGWTKAGMDKMHKLDSFLRDMEGNAAGLDIKRLLRLLDIWLLFLGDTRGGHGGSTGISHGIAAYPPSWLEVMSSTSAVTAYTLRDPVRERVHTWTAPGVWVLVRGAGRTEPQEQRQFQKPGTRSKGRRDETKDRVLKTEATNGGQDKCDDSRGECPWDQSGAWSFEAAEVRVSYREVTAVYGRITVQGTNFRVCRSVTFTRVLCQLRKVWTETGAVRRVQKTDASEERRKEKRLEKKRKGGETGETGR
ncbi:hypothetical protein BJV74DRAFT_985546 [Russula compacta]|nr:hypothetical protein BJV74DRAFT_985546 [Russula compacta]